MTDTHVDPPDLDLERDEVVVDKPAERDWDKDARGMGWQPKDDWRGDPDGWRDAETFVKRGDEIIGHIRRDRDAQREKASKAETDRDDRIRRLEGQYTEALKAQAKQHAAEMETIKSDERKAVVEGDVEAFDALGKRKEALGTAPEVREAPAPQPDDTVKEWAKKNPWFYTDPQMRALATATAETAAQSGADAHAQVAAAEAEVRKRFADKFEPPKASVEVGGHSPKRGPKSKGVAELPAEARKAFDGFVKMGVYKAEDIKEYATSYWEQE